MDQDKNNLPEIHHFIFATITCLLMVSLSAFSAESQLKDTWLNPLSEGWEVRPLLKAGDYVGKNNYRMTGIPDGLGALDNGDGTISIFMNHEIPSDKGLVRRHGANGAFVSHWILDKETLKIVDGEDWIRRVMLWDKAEERYAETPSYSFNRLCSANLAPKSAFYNESNGKGFNGYLFLNGEEVHDHGKAFAHVISGKQAGISYELPHLGKFAWENAVANPLTGDKTVVMGMDDSFGGQVYVYVGDKCNCGNPVERAGLAGGNLYAVKVENKRFSLVSLGDVSRMNGDELEKASRAAGATGFLRPEDGAWDTKNSNLFYFATTDKINGSSQLFRLAFEDSKNPELGGSIEAVLKARDIGAQMFDNIVAGSDGRLLVEEDPGDNPHAASIWQFDPATGNATKLLAVAPERFVNKNDPAFMTQDEENSGIIEITSLVHNASWASAGHRYYLGVLQVHAASADAEVIEDGQLYLVSSPGN